LLSAPALSKLLDRKPHLLRSLAAQLLPPRHPSIDPAEHLGIDLSPLRTAEDCRLAMPTVLAAIGRGEIEPAEGAGIARWVRPRLRSIRKLARAANRSAHVKPVRPATAGGNEGRVAAPSPIVHSREPSGQCQIAARIPSL
jgi:hypothetical protein